MADITMCPGTDCPVRETCYRFTAKPSEHRQSYFFQPPGGQEDGKFTCEMYWGATQDNVLRELEKIMKIR
jgi:hypothetical protein